jgi:hypothetical protein
MLKDGYEYQIQRSDGLFSTGGYWPRFSKRGKIWRTIGHLKAHLRYFSNLKNRYPEHYTDHYQDCVVVKYVLCRSVAKDDITPASLMSEDGK